MTATALQTPFGSRWSAQHRQPLRWGLSDSIITEGQAFPEPVAVFDNDRFGEWLEPTLSRIVDLLKLPAGWDYYEGQPIRLETATFALQLLTQMLDEKTPAPQVVPLSSGGVQFEWHEKGIDLEIEVAGPNDVILFFEDTVSGEAIERELAADFKSLVRPIDLLTNR